MEELMQPFAVKSAQECVEKVWRRLTRKSETISTARLRGYLRATATTAIDSTLEKLIPQQDRAGGVLEQVRSCALALLEQMILEKLQQSSTMIPSRSAAA
jgi:uncharacterized membrane protein YheB (UPF0754 family)